MVGLGRLKTDDQRIGSKRQEFKWTNLPMSGNRNHCPPMPSGVFDAEAEIKWQELWALPQSLMWDGSYETVAKYIHLWATFYAGASSPLATAMTACEDRLGLSPKSMLQMRWRIVNDGLADERFGGLPESKLAIVESIKTKKNEELDFDA